MPGALRFIQDSHVVAEAQGLEPSIIAFLGTLGGNRIWSKVAGIWTMAYIQDTNIAGGGLTCYTIRPAPNLSFILMGVLHCVEYSAEFSTKV